MTLEEFKFIYWMEYAHRMWGRALGFVFAVPAVYFGVRGYINSALAKSLGLFFLMGGTQGLVGWWMVKSGLQVFPLSYAHPVGVSKVCLIFLGTSSHEGKLLAPTSCVSHPSPSPILSLSTSSSRPLLPLCGTNAVDTCLQLNCGCNTR